MSPSASAASPVPLPTYGALFAGGIDGVYVALVQAGLDPDCSFFAESDCGRLGRLVKMYRESASPAADTLLVLPAFVVCTS